MSLGSLAFIPAPPFDTIGPFRLYGLMIALGVVAAVWLAGRRLEAAVVGGEEHQRRGGVLRRELRLQLDDPGALGPDREAVQR